MGKYESINCPICNEPLENGSDISICPECGAPYHLKCIKKTGECIYTDLHESGKAWESPNKEKEKEQKYAAPEPRKCSRCGTLNPIDGIFCEVCGNPLDSKSENSEQRQNPYPNMGDKTQQNIPPQMPFNPFTTPFGGLSADDVIDDVPIKDVAIFVKQNTPYFLPKFKKYSLKEKFYSFNIPATFFHGFYFMYRKMYLLGALVLIAILTLSIPNILLTIDQLSASMDISIKTTFTSDNLVALSNVCWFIQLALRMICGMFFNRLYYSHCAEKIKEIQEKDLPHGAYIEDLTKKGGISTKAIGSLLIGYIIFSFIVSFLLLFFM